jgi:hypothetical protein
MALGLQPRALALAPAVDAIVARALATLQHRPGWANARDAKEMFFMLQKRRDIRFSTGAGSGAGPGASVTEVTAEDATEAVAQFLRQRPEASTATSQRK